MQEPVRWAAQLAGVREVSLLGTADLGFWRNWLAGSGLELDPLADCAQLMLVAAEGRFFGLTFRELSFSVLVRFRTDDRNRPGAYLLQAYNSRRLFAFCERRLFSTPYDQAEVILSAAPPIFSQLSSGGRNTFRAQLHTDGAHPVAAQSVEGWEGPSFLPARGGRPVDRFFFAHLRGVTDRYSYRNDHDQFELAPHEFPVLRALADSNFRPREWVIRAQARHGKSKTYPVDRLPQIEFP